jgi:hypothetical protein
LIEMVRVGADGGQLAWGHGFAVAPGLRPIGAIETPLFAGPATAPDYLLVRTSGAIDGTFRAVPTSLVVDVDIPRRAITLGTDHDSIAALPEHLPLERR